MDNPGDWDSPSRKAEVPFHMSVSPAASQGICLLLRSQSCFLAGKCLTLKLVARYTCSHFKCLGWGMSRGGHFQASHGERETSPIPAQALVPLNKSQIWSAKGSQSCLGIKFLLQPGLDSPGLRLGGRARELSMHLQSFELS